MESEDVLISVHSQYGYGHGEGRDEIIHRTEEFEGHTILLKDDDAGEVYGDEDMYDLVVEDDLYGNLDEDLSNVVRQAYGNIEIIGIYGSECVANTAESIGIEEVTINPDALVDQTFGSGDYLVSDLLETRDPEIISRYVEKFRNADTAGRIEFKDGLLDDYNISLDVPVNSSEGVEAADEDEGVEILT
ncbi:MAG: hypothetical protein J07AB43_16230 [Candidatus Nanosalina sp. J07AB43]|nr:MAG: hypothetical protein J07AB43_16230 [Candidatus Nanosalina sp. J07AB43]